MSLSRRLYRRYKFAKRLCRAQKCQIFYKFSGGILRIFSRNLSPTRPNARKNTRKFHARSVRFTQLRLGRGYLGVSRKFSLNLIDLRSNLKAAYRLLRALPSRWLRRCRALRYTDRAVRVARRGYPLRARFASIEIKISMEWA